MKWLGWPLVAAVVLSGQLAAASERAVAQEVVPVPLMVIYPMDMITPEMLGNGSVPPPVPTSTYFMSKQDIIGKVARQTLLPGRPIPIVSVMTPRLFPQGARVKIMFDASGISASAVGTALESGSAGDRVRVRNNDSNLIVVGRVEADGAVHVGSD